MAANAETLKGVAVTKSIRIKGSIAVQSGIPILTGFARADELVPRTEVDQFDSENNTGYQREPQQPRIRKAAQYYEDGGRMPNPLLVNIREDDFGKIELILSADDRAGYEAAIESGGNWIGTAKVVIPAGVKIWIFDGQHRDGATNLLVTKYPEKFGNWPVPLSMTLGLDTASEMKEFYEVNQNAKAVKTDLAWELLRKMAEEDPELAEILEIKGNWQVKGGDVVDELIARGGVWSDKIQRANVRKTTKDRLTLNSAQFIRSLQPVLAMPLFAKADTETIAAVLNAYWDGIAMVLPEPFAPDSDPKKYVIQKGPGAIAFHRVLPQVIDVLRARGKRLGDAAAYAEVLKDLPNLSGEVMLEGGKTVDVTGAKFWLAGPEGVASQWTGDAGRKRLAVRIQALLPRPVDELNL
jgi:DGQHR domain-containing protein